MAEVRLIDANALKRTLAEATYNFEQIPIRVDKVMDIIDNAPTVLQVTVFAENASKEEIEDFKQELENVLERHKGECESCRHRDPEDKKCYCGKQERQGCPFPVRGDYYCKYYEKGGGENDNG